MIALSAPPPVSLNLKSVAERRSAKRALNPSVHQSALYRTYLLSIFEIFSSLRSLDLKPQRKEIPNLHQNLKSLKGELMDTWVLGFHAFSISSGGTKGSPRSWATGSLVTFPKHTFKPFLKPLSASKASFQPLFASVVA